MNLTATSVSDEAADIEALNGRLESNRREFLWCN